MNLHALLGCRPGSDPIVTLLANVAIAVGIGVPEPTVKMYKDAVYHSYLSLGISFNYEPRSPLSVAQHAPKPDFSQLSLVAIHLYSHPTDKFATFPLTFTVGLPPTEGIDPHTKLIVELDMNKKAHEIVSLLGEPEKKDGGGRAGNCWIGYQATMADNGHGLSHVDISPLEDRIVKLIDTHKVMVFSKSYCPYSAGAKKLLMSYTLDFNIMEVDLEDDDKAIKDVLIKVSHGHSTFPSVFLKGVSIGGFDKLDAMDREGKLKPYLEQLGVELER
ncbi:hypothetical protein BG004_007534 [Podila humilis]|nr:hypothetical protein BG004_007534 [Podila humilis]